ncbi:enolase C-terminal domain-like protein [Lapidilactobacillus salsurivasis]
MEVIPVAGYDSMLLTLSGAHAPYFTRNIVILTDDSGAEGIGEIHGGEHTRGQLEGYRDLVLGRRVTDYREIIRDLKRHNQKSSLDSGEGIQKLDISQLKFVVQSDAAVECALLDLVGKFVDLPMASLLGEGMQRDEVEFLGYLFYTGDPRKTDLPYLIEDGQDDWEQIRRTEMLTPAAIVKQAQAAQKRYGFKNFKLKGGVFSGRQELETVKALKTAFPDANINLDPNGCWPLADAVELSKEYQKYLAYMEDPCGPEAGFSSREIHSWFKNQTHCPVATNMIATNWKQFYHAASLRAVDIVLADPHFWGFNGSIRMAQILNDWGLTWGSHSNNHFDITLAAFAQTAAAAPGQITAIDTHYIWQDGQELCGNALKIQDGKIKIPAKPGLGIEIDRQRLSAANKLYETMPARYRDRDDTLAIQYLEKDWVFDSKRPVFEHH